MKGGDNMKRRLLVSLSTAILAFGAFVVPMAAATSATVTITATPTFIAMTLSENAWTLGAVLENTTYHWTADGLIVAEPLVDGDMKATITNTGSVAEDFNIKVAAFTGGVGWAISTDNTPSADEVAIRAGITGMANRAAMIQVITTDTELVDNLAAAGTKMMCLELLTGTFTDGVAKSGTLTVTAVAHT
jgi:hypothetical protein